jgi:hypothetical protein
MGNDGGWGSDVIPARRKRSAAVSIKVLVGESLKATMLWQLSEIVVQGLQWPFVKRQINALQL